MIANLLHLEKKSLIRKEKHTSPLTNENQVTDLNREAQGLIADQKMTEV